MAEMRPLNPDNDYWEDDTQMIPCICCNDDVSVFVLEKIVFGHYHRICTHCINKIKTFKRDKKYGI